MPQPLARIVQDELLTGPRGPDGRHEIVVPRSWLAEGAWVEIPLPRLLSCALCDGGGCDRCHRSGAVTTRVQQMSTEVIEVQLPVGGPAILRLPRLGGLPSPGEALGRGLLLLTIRVGAEPSAGLRKLPDRASLRSVHPSPIPPHPRLKGTLLTPHRILALAALCLIVGILWWLRQ
ncbi:MAG: hypothetical protein RMJ98_06970 [Myxococcales bacterium]|nr:hypothetical protein [Polyangiaceae bacterium]MDW8249028.1 hypothetical protein [Myxococcales bacterium]